jgi:hypothetical protein
MPTIVTNFFDGNSVTWARACFYENSETIELMKSCVNEARNWILNKSPKFFDQVFKLVIFKNILGMIYDQHETSCYILKILPCFTPQSSSIVSIHAKIWLLNSIRYDNEVLTTSHILQNAFLNSSKHSNSNSHLLASLNRTAAQLEWFSYHLGFKPLKNLHAKLRQWVKNWWKILFLLRFTEPYRKSIFFVTSSTLKWAEI